MGFYGRLCDSVPDKLTRCVNEDRKCFEYMKPNNILVSKFKKMI